MTFNTNYTRLLLRVITSVTNYSSSFTAVYLYIKSKSARVQQQFIKQYTRVHQPEAQLLKVIVTDLSEGLYVVYPNSKLSTATLQFCQWHAFQVIYKKINTRAYSSRSYNKKRHIQIKDYIQAYLQAATKEELNYHREALL